MRVDGHHDFAGVPDVDQALTLLADEVVCEAPNGTFEGVEGYRR
ncbi:hypothetical protein [Actinomadura sp. 6N118]